MARPRTPEAEPIRVGLPDDSLAHDLGTMPSADDPVKIIPAKSPDALKAARRVLSILLPFSQRRRQAILQMAAMLCDPETP